MLFDSHAHLDDERFDIDRKQLINNLREKGISYVVDPGSDIPSSQLALQLAKEYDFIYAAVGIHPESANEMTSQVLDTIRKLAQDPRVVAIGEIGLDYHYDDGAPREAQKATLEKQLELAAELKLPVIIHNREAHKDTLEIIKAYRRYLTGCVLHSYSGSWEMAKKLLNLDCYISLAGPVTFKNALKPVEVAKNIDLNSLLIETDSPYLTPHPHRGKRNNPAMVGLVAEKIADIRGMETEEIARITCENAKKFFGIK